MFTESMLRKNPTAIHAFTGIPAEHFWLLLEKVEAEFFEYELKRHTRADRKRAVGAGRKFEQSLPLRLVAVLTYLRLHTPQIVISAIFGVPQHDISRDLRRLLPLIRDVLPCPEIWEIPVENPSFIPMLPLQLDDGLALIDATEQRVSRPGGDNQTRKLFFSGKQGEFTLKTQIATDGNHHIAAVSMPVPGSMHDKKLCDKLQTLERLPRGCEVGADKGYQGLATDNVSSVTVPNAETGAEQQVPRVTAYTPFKKTKGKELTESQKVFNRHLAAIRVRVEHCIGWIKNWAILATRFRCAHSIYGTIMQTICGLVNQQTQRWQAVRASAYCA